MFHYICDQNTAFIKFVGSISLLFVIYLKS